MYRLLRTRELTQEGDEAYLGGRWCKCQSGLMVLGDAPPIRRRLDDSSILVDVKEVKDGNESPARV